MKLFRFPWLIHRNILKQMEYGQLFLLSLCSKNSTMLIQSVNWKEVKTIEYYSISRLIKIKIVNKDDEMTPLLNLHPGIKSARRTLTVFDKELHFVYNKETSVTLVIDGSKDKQFSRKILDHINNLFGKRAKWITWSNSGAFSLPENIRFSEIYFTFRFSKRLSAKGFDEFFGMNPIQEHVELIAEIKGDFRQDSKIFRAPTLFISSLFVNTENIVYNFKGRELFLIYPILQQGTCIDFLKKWKSNEILQNLEFLTIASTKPARFEAKLFKKELKMKKLPESIEPQPINFNSRFILPDVRKSKVSTYIVNDNGIVAFIGVIGQRLVFSVKQFTEEEMLGSRMNSITPVPF